jgi:hypothetical protein
MTLFGEAVLLFEALPWSSRMTIWAEPRRTSRDGWHIGEDYRVATECKFTETDLRAYSRSPLKPEASNYESAAYKGNYERQRARKVRCSLTEGAVKYSQLVPRRFFWIVART